MDYNRQKKRILLHWALIKNKKTWHCDYVDVNGEENKCTALSIETTRTDSLWAVCLLSVRCMYTYSDRRTNKKTCGILEHTFCFIYIMEMDLIRPKSCSLLISLAPILLHPLHLSWPRASHFMYVEQECTKWTAEIMTQILTHWRLVVARG